MIRLAVLLAAGALIGCRGQDRPREPPRRPPPVVQRDSTIAAPADSAEGPTATAAWTAGIVDLPANGEGQPILTAVRNAAHEDYDRIVFQFEPGGLPGVHAEYVDRPVRQCGSGEVIPVAGDAWLLIRFTPAAAHTKEGRPSVGERLRRVNQPALKELDLICDFEADVTWVLGVSSPNRFRVFSLSSPPRVIVDIRH